MYSNQLLIFLIFIVVGFIISFIFDTIRSIKKCFKSNRILTNIGDVLLTITTGIIIIYTILKFNFGELRFYIFLANIIGITLYFVFASKYISKIVEKITFIIKKIFVKICKKLKDLRKKCRII